MPSVNNFRHAPNCQKADYKLWVAYRKELVSDRLPRYKTYYSFNHKRNPQYGLHRLMQLVQKRMQLIEIAIIYDNRKNVEVYRFK